MVRWSGIREPAHPDALAFSRRVLRAADNMRIPLYVRTIFDCTVEIVHAQWLDTLDVPDWWIIGHIGQQAATLGGFTVRYHPVYGPGPSWWEVDCDEPSDYVDTSGCCPPRWVSATGSALTP